MQVDQDGQYEEDNAIPVTDGTGATNLQDIDEDIYKDEEVK